MTTTQPPHAAPRLRRPPSRPASAVRPSGRALTWTHWPTRRMSLRDAAALAMRAGMVGAAYFVAAWFGRLFMYQSSHIGLVWPAGAVFVSGLILARDTRERWAVVVATSVAHAIAMHVAIEPWRLSWQIIVNTGFAWLALVALRRIAGL